MYVISIEHPVPDYQGWKKVFDSDPPGRRRMGVRRFRVLRALDNPNHVMVDLEFDTTGEARAGPVARIAEQLEEKTP